MWYEIGIRSKDDIVEAATLALYDLDIVEMVVEDPNIISQLSDDEKSWDYADENVLPFDHEDTLVKVTIALEEEKKDGFFRDLKTAFFTYYPEGNDDGGVSFYIEETDPDEYKDEWKKYFKPFYICDKVLVCPSWEECSPAEGDKIIDIDPSGAFGTGNHETTSMCARLINEHISKRDSVLDMGCGSGILSLVAAKLGASRVLAFDIDENAVNIARENVVKNDSSTIIDVTSCIDDSSDVFDIVVANIIADVIMDIAEGVKKRLVNRGLFIVSGIISERKNEVLDDLLGKGYTLCDEWEENGWCALSFRLENE